MSAPAPSNNVTPAGHTQPEVTEEKVAAPAAAAAPASETPAAAAPAEKKKAGRFDKTFVRPLSTHTA